MTQTVLSILEHAKATLSHGWTKGAMARNKDQNNKEATNPEACYYCISGAVFKQFPPMDGNDGWVEHYWKYPLLKETIDTLARNRPPNAKDSFIGTGPLWDLIAFNDTCLGIEKRDVMPTAPEPIMSLLERAIESCKQQ